MEHRLSERASLHTPVVIYYNSLGLLQANALNLSRHGMFVHTGRLSLPLHALIEVAFPLRRARNLPPQRAKAMVVRVTHSGMGLMFDDEMEMMDIGQQHLDTTINEKRLVRAG